MRPNENGWESWERDGEVGGMEHKPGSNSGYLLRVSVGGARIDGRTELLVATHQMETSLLKHKRSKTLATKD